MEMEPDLFGGLPTPVEHRTYFALLPPPALAQRIEHDARRLGRLHNVRTVIAAHRLHVSLNGIQRGSALEPEQLEYAFEIGGAIRRPPFDLVFDRLQTWDGGRSGQRRHPPPTVLCCAEPPREAAALYDDLRRQMQRLGLRVGPRAFRPHITLWYAPARLAARVLNRPVRLRVNRFCLVHTVSGAAKAEHLASWPLKF